GQRVRADDGVGDSACTQLVGQVAKRSLDGVATHPASQSRFAFEKRALSRTIDARRFARAHPESAVELQRTQASGSSARTQEAPSSGVADAALETFTSRSLRAASSIHSLWSAMCSSSSTHCEMAGRLRIP